MLKPLTSPERVFLLAVLGLMVCAVGLPASWLRWWSNDIAAIVNVPFLPVADLASGFRSQLRPPPSMYGPFEGDPEVLLAQSLQERETLRVQVQQLQREIEELRLQL